MRKYIIFENELDTSVRHVVEFEGEFKPKDEGWGDYTADTKAIIEYLSTVHELEEADVYESFNWMPMYDEDFAMPVSL